MATTPAAPPASTLEPNLSPDGFRTTPDHTNTGWPPGVPYIVGNEACERFSFYGMKAILYVHLVSLYFLADEVRLHALNLAGGAGAAAGAGALATVMKGRAENLATSTTHLFIAAVYALPMIGAIIADRLAGKYKTILYLSLVYCLGHAVLSAGENSLVGMYIGLGLIAVGSGGIKPCVSANVGDQFGKANWFRVRTIFQIFYFSINFGSFFATIMIPRTKLYLGPSVAFAIPGILMFLATIIFWMGRRTYVHVPPKPGGTLGLLDTLSSVAFFMAVGHLFFSAAHLPRWGLLLVSAGFLGLGLLLFQTRQRLAPDNGFLAIMFFTLGRLFGGRRPEPITAGAAPVNGEPHPLARNWFWAPAVERFGGHATEGPVAVLKIISVFFLVSVFWALFDQHSSSWIRQAEMMDLTVWGSTRLLAPEISAVNPLLVMVLIPVMNVLYALSDSVGFRATPLRRMTLGMFISSLAFVASALIQRAIDTTGHGQVWFLWQLVPYLFMTVGEVMVSITGLEFAYTQAPKAMKSTIMGFWLLTVTLGNVLVALLARFGKLPLEEFFWVFAGLMAGAGLLFGIRALFYVQKDYPQE